MRTKLTNHLEYLMKETNISSVKEMKAELKIMKKINKNDKQQVRYINYLIKECKYYDSSKPNKKVQSR